MYDAAKGRYDMILGQDIFTYLGLNLKFSKHITEVDDGPFKGYETPMVDFGMYIFKDLNTEKLHLKKRLLMITLKKYISHNMQLLPQEYYM